MKRRMLLAAVLLLAFVPTAEAKTQKLSMGRAKHAIRHPPKPLVKPEKILRCVRLTKRSVKCKTRFRVKATDDETGERLPEYDSYYYVYTYATLKHGRVRLRDVF